MRDWMDIILLFIYLLWNTLRNKVRWIAIVITLCLFPSIFKNHFLPSKVLWKSQETLVRLEKSSIVFLRRGDGAHKKMGFCQSLTMTLNSVEVLMLCCSFFVNMDIINQFSFVMKYSKSNSSNKDKDHHSKRSCYVKKSFQGMNFFYFTYHTSSKDVKIRPFAALSDVFISRNNYRIHNLLAWIYN